MILAGSRWFLTDVLIRGNPFAKSINGREYSRRLLLTVTRRDKAVEDPKGETPAEMWRSQPMGKVEYLEALEGDDADPAHNQYPSPRPDDSILKASLVKLVNTRYKQRV
jgi:hypothetical protein